MQYPIIDNLIYAYQRNGWTGLNLIPQENINLLSIYNGSYDDNYMHIESNGGVISFQMKQTTSVNFRYYYFDIQPIVIPVSIQQGRNGCMYLFNNFSTSNVSLDLYNNDTRIELWTCTPVNRFTDSYISQGGKLINKVAIRVGTFTQGYTGRLSPMFTNDGIIYDEFVPYNFPKTDIDKRLKLPMIHYFQHPVIDALQRAAAGTQTADDTEILRHYLTPLGIGGI